MDFYVDLEEECHEEIDEVIPKYPANAKSYFIGMLHRLWNNYWCDLYWRVWDISQQPVYWSSSTNNLVGGGLIHNITPDTNKAVVLDIFSAVPNCHANKVKCKTWF